MNKAMDNCKTCLFANINKDGSVDCDKRVLLTGEMINIEAENVDKPCPAHSSRFIPETRYGFDNQDMRKAEDACEVCGRILDMSSKDTYDYVTEEFTASDDDGNEEVKKEIVQECKICIDKGRHKFA